MSGHVGVSESTRLDSDTNSLIVDFTVTKSVHDVKSFHGLASYFRKLVQGFVSILYHGQIHVQVGKRSYVKNILGD